MDPTQAPIEAVHDFSFLGLFLQADPIVKGVMLLLVIASIACWTVVFEKVIRLTAARRQAKAFATLVRSGGGLDGDHRASRATWSRPPSTRGATRTPTETRAERRERIERAMKGALTLEMKRLRTGLSLLATSGSTAPFVGLFGTVWGIMNSFSSIARARTRRSPSWPRASRRRFRHRDRPRRRDPGRDGLQQARERRERRPGHVRLLHLRARQPPGPRPRGAHAAPRPSSLRARTPNERNRRRPMAMGSPRATTTTISTTRRCPRST